MSLAKVTSSVAPGCARVARGVEQNVSTDATPARRNTEIRDLKGALTFIAHLSGTFARTVEQFIPWNGVKQRLRLPDPADTETTIVYLLK